MSNKILIILLIALTVGCGSNKKKPSTGSGQGINTNCTPNLFRPMPFETSEVATTKSVQFNYSSSTSQYRYSSPFSYASSTDNYPDYRIPGNACFTVFGNGNYSWKLDPFNTYENQRQYVVWSEMTRIKNGGGPPPSILYESELDVCEHDNSIDPFQIKNLTQDSLAMELSRPMYLDSNHIHIISFGNYYKNEDVDMKIYFDFNELEYVQKLTHVNEPMTANNYNDSRAFSSPGNSTGIIEIDKMALSKGKEYRFFIEFKAKGNRVQPCDFSTSSIRVEIYRTGSNFLLNSETYSYPVQQCKPRDPNWLNFETTPCPLSIKPQFQMHKMKGHFYFLANESKKELAARVNVKALSNNVYSIEHNGHAYSNGNNGKKELLFDSCLPGNTCKKFKGYGNTSSKLDILGDIGFNIKLYPLKPNQLIELEIETTFYGEDNFTLKPYKSVISYYTENCDMDPKKVIQTPKDANSKEDNRGKGKN